MFAGTKVCVLILVYTLNDLYQPIRVTLHHHITLSMYIYTDVHQYQECKANHKYIFCSLSLQILLCYFSKICCIVPIIIDLVSMVTTSQLVKVVGELWDAFLQALTLTSIGNDDGWREEENRERWGEERKIKIYSFIAYGWVGLGSRLKRKHLSVARTPPFHKDTITKMAAP